MFESTTNSREQVMQQLEETYRLDLAPWVKQRKLAPILRSVAMDHLHHGIGQVALDFQESIQNPALKADYANFFQERSKNGIWASDIEYQALCEFFAVNGWVTSINAKQEKRTWQIHKAINDDAPTIHLHNSNNVHWYVQNPSDILGDGNCLYNAFATALQTASFAHTIQRKVVAHAAQQPFGNTVKADESRQNPEEVKLQATADAKQQQAQAEPKLTASQAPKQSGLFKPSHMKVTDDQAIALQRQLLAQLSKKSSAPTQALEQERIAKLPLAEQQQINNDYKLALKLAREEARQAICSSSINEPQSTSPALKF